MKLTNFLKATAAIAMFVAAPLSATAQVEDHYIKITEPGDSAVTKHVVLGINKSMVVELAHPAADVVITNPEIADAVVQTANRIIFRGVKVGQTNAFLFDRDGKQLLDLELSVEMDMAGLDKVIKMNVPDARIELVPMNGNLLITGNVDSLAQADAVQRLAAAYMGSSEDLQIVNMMNIAAKDQVMLEVRIVEMQRNAVKQLGIRLSGVSDLSGIAGTGNDAGELALTTANGYNVQGSALGGLAGELELSNLVGNGLQSTLGFAFDALERVGIVKTLAEPNITAISGESAKFLAGGEFPVPVGRDQDGNVTIEFKPYGVGLGFTPVVLSEGRISLKVSTEVSELTAQGAFQGASRTVIIDGEVLEGEGLTIPALTVRRAESTVELPSGQSMMLAGLIQSRSRQTLDQVPGLKKLPVLGALFQSRDFLNEETELVIIITPYLVDPTAKSNLRTPDTGFANASDPKTVFFGKLNATYGQDGLAPNANDYRAPVGFIEE